MSTSIDIDDVMTPYPGPCIQHPPSGNLEHVTSAHFKTVQCEEVEDEDDLIAIRGVRWQENDYLQTGILEEITDLPEVISHDCYGAHEIVDDFVDDDETDAASEDGEKCDYSFELRKPPTIEEARKALDSLQQLLKPPRKDKTGYKDPKLPPVLKERLVHMKNFLWLYVDVGKDGRTHAANPVGGHWQLAADRAARNARGGKSTKGDYMSRRLRHWSKAYISHREALPIRDAPCKLSRIDDEGLASAVKDHLQSCGKYVCAQDIVDYSNVAENQALHGFKKGSHSRQLSGG
jgi:hypothetical protein